MSNPTLTWATAGPTAFSIAGSTVTAAEFLAALNAQVVASATYWEVSAYSAVNGTLELKRKVASSPTGELATIRILIMAGQVPHANCLSLLHSAGSATSIYGCLSVDANTTGPGTSYASGAPYSTKYVRAGLVGTAALNASDNPRITLFESADSFGFVYADNIEYASFCAGRIIERGDTGVLVWGVMPSGNYWLFSNTNNALSTLVQGSFMPPISLAANGQKCNYWDTVTASSRLFGRLLAFVTYGAVVNTYLGQNGVSSRVLGNPVGESAAIAGSTMTYFGELRQMRFGPLAAHLDKLKDSGAVLQATHLFGGSGSGIGMWLDELP